MGHWWPLILSSPDPALPPGLWWWAQWRSTSKRGCQRPTAWLPCRDSNCSSLSAPGMARQHPTWWQRCSGLHLLLSRGRNMVKLNLKHILQDFFCESVQIFESLSSPWAQKPMYKALRPQRYPIAWVQPTMASCPLIQASLYPYTGELCINLAGSSSSNINNFVTWTWTLGFPNSGVGYLVGTTYLPVQTIAWHSSKVKTGHVVTNLLNIYWRSSEASITPTIQIAMQFRHDKNKHAVMLSEQVDLFAHS